MNIPTWAKDRTNRRVVIGGTYRDTFGGEETIFTVCEHGPVDPDTNTWCEWSELDLSWNRKTIQRVA